MHERTAIAYVAPWVDLGGSDKGTLDWFRWIDRDRFAPSLITTQPSLNRRVHEMQRYAEEVWVLPELLAGMAVPQFIFDFLHTRDVGVMHIMNSRIAFDLLPDLGNLPSPPKVVVQLHVEEADRSGYVRYVTTRYGNLVDAFSVTSDHLAAAVEGYDIPRRKIHVIRTGVDAKGEFSPEHTAPLGGLRRGCFHVLYPGRLVDQKDPMLMVEVARRLREAGSGFCIHVVGEGELEAPVREAVGRHGLGEVVKLHPATSDLGPWYAACDALLMTSRFEGVPYVAYEAMAMGMPVVAPALPGNVELIEDDLGVLVDPRDDAAGYARALGGLVNDPARSARMGRRARENMLERHSLRQMASLHESLYEDVLGPRVAVPARGEGPVRSGALRRRPVAGQPLVSVVIPCFDHGRYLRGCLASVRQQKKCRTEILVVDDGSSDPETLQVLDELEEAADVRLLRLEANRGPSAARNHGIEGAGGRYVLFVDADNLLMEDAVWRLVDQIASSGERVGYIYPNLQFFGNRDDYFEAPSFNLATLMHVNYCDTGSLFDSEIFERGHRFDESIVLGHEDWDFVLTLAEHGIIGEPAQHPTLLYRKHGFTRSDRVHHGPAAPDESPRARHPRLYGRLPYESPAVDLEAEWNPAVTVISLDPIGHAEVPEVLAHLDAQTCRDAELVVRTSAPVPRDRAPVVRRLPAELAPTRAAALAFALNLARGQIVVLLAGAGVEPLTDPAFLEKLVRIFAGKPDLDAIVLADSVSTGRFSLRLIGPDETGRPRPVGVVFRASLPTDGMLQFAEAGGREISGLALALRLSGATVQWRYAPSVGVSEERTSLQAAIAGVDEPTGRAAHARRLASAFPPAMPDMPAHTVRRWDAAVTWEPAEAVLLTRFRERGGERRISSRIDLPPAGFELEYHLGAGRQFPLPGTRRLFARNGREYVTLAPGERDPELSEEDELCCVEQAPLPLLDALILGRLPATGEEVLVCGPDDPLMGVVQPIATLGFLESYPVNPRRPPHVERGDGLPGLVQTVDGAARRHRYAVGEVPSGTLVRELGALLSVEPMDGVCLAIDGRGHVVTSTYAPSPQSGRARLAVGARWTLAPLSWPGKRLSAPRLRASLRRAQQVAGVYAAASGEAEHGRPVDIGWLLSESHPRCRALWSAAHPVTSDQYLSHTPIEATDLGYVEPTLLGYILHEAPATGRHDHAPVPIPWASRFGVRGGVA